jgi:hypothetical protein
MLHGHTYHAEGGSRGGRSIGGGGGGARVRFVVLHLLAPVRRQAVTFSSEQACREKQAVTFSCDIQLPTTLAERTRL